MMLAHSSSHVTPTMRRDTTFDRMVNDVYHNTQIETTSLPVPKGEIRILLLEDVASDVELNEIELRRAGIPFTSTRVETREGFLKALEDFSPDVVLSDYSLPDFSAMEALEVLKERKNGTPFILVTGSQSEEVAVDCLKQGADDYILKQNLRRLPSALLRVLETKQAERTRKTAERQLRTSNKELRALSAHFQSVREEERSRIAREIHDELGQTLTALRLDLAWLQNKVSSIGGKCNAEVKDLIGEMSELVDSTIQTVRRISTELRPRILDELGLLPALEWQTEEFQNRTGIRSRFSSNVEEITLDRDRSTAMFRIVQESLTNVARHAKATEVNVRLAVSVDRVTLTVEDNGKGIDGAQPVSLQSFGILGMRERAHLLGGDVAITNRQGGGTTVMVELPRSLADEPS